MPKMEIDQLKVEIRTQIIHSLFTDLSSLDVFNDTDRTYFKRMVTAKVDYLMECIDKHVKLYLPSGS